MTGRRVGYDDGDLHLEGFLAVGDSKLECPGVLVVPTWLNLNESICTRAERIAAAGFAAFVVDLFGAGIRPAPPQLPQAVVAPFLDDRSLFRRRLLAGLRVLQGRPECDGSRMAAVGYCLGGCGVLELARVGAPLRGVVSLHGLLTTPMPAAARAMTAKVLVLHGDADPLVPFDQLAAFRTEMLEARANWEINIYSDARHSFTGEGILDQESSEAARHDQSESRSWRSTLEFLVEVLS